MSTLVFASCATALVGLMVYLAVGSANRAADRAARRERFLWDLQLKRKMFNAEYALKKRVAGFVSPDARLPDGI